MTKLLLYDHPVSSYTQKVRIALRQKGIQYNSEIPPNLGDGSIPEKLHSANPRVEVPALEDGDFKIFDSKVILQYLEETYPDNPLLPRDPQGRAEARMIQEVCDTHYEAINWGIGEIRWMKRASGDLADKLLAQAKKQTDEMYSFLTARLGEKQYFNGDAFGSSGVAPFVKRSDFFGYGPLEGSQLQKWFVRIQELPSVKQTYSEFEAGVSRVTALADAFKPGAGNTREYRDHRLEWMIKSGGISIVENGINEETIRFS